MVQRSQESVCGAGNLSKPRIGPQNSCQGVNLQASLLYWALGLLGLQLPDLWLDTDFHHPQTLNPNPVSPSSLSWLL